MNHSIHSADRSTHLKVVVIALIAICSRIESPAATAGVIKAGQPVAMTSLTVAVTR